MLITPEYSPTHTSTGMTSIRAFIISSSMLLTVWLAASYATQFEKNTQTPAAQRPSASAEASISTEAERGENVERGAS